MFGGVSLGGNVATGLFERIINITHAQPRFFFWEHRQCQKFRAFLHPEWEVVMVGVPHLWNVYMQINIWYTSYQNMDGGFNDSLFSPLIWGHDPIRRTYFLKVGWNHQRLLQSLTKQPSMSIVCVEVRLYHWWCVHQDGHWHKFGLCVHLWFLEARWWLKGGASRRYSGFKQASNQWLAPAIFIFFWIFADSRNCASSIAWSIYLPPESPKNIHQTHPSRLMRISSPTNCWIHCSNWNFPMFPCFFFRFKTTPHPKSIPLFAGMERFFSFWKKYESKMGFTQFCRFFGDEKTLPEFVR